MEGFKQQVVAVQQCQSALRLPEEVLASLPICRTAQTLQQEASQLQHTTIQQCNILQVEGSPCTAHTHVAQKNKCSSGITSACMNPTVPANACMSKRHHKQKLSPWSGAVLS